MHPRLYSPTTKRLRVGTAQLTCARANSFLQH